MKTAPSLNIAAVLAIFAAISFAVGGALQREKGTSAVGAGGSLNTPPVVAPAATPFAGNIPNHVPTWGYDGFFGGETDGTDIGSNCTIGGSAPGHCTNDASQKRIQAWYDIAEGDKGIQDCGPVATANPGEGAAPCSDIQYIDWARDDYSPGNDKNFVDQMTALNLPNDGAFFHTGTPGTLANRNLSTCGGHPCPAAIGSEQHVQDWWSCLIRGTGSSAPLNCPNVLGPNHNAYQGYREGTLFFADTTASGCNQQFYRYTVAYPYELGGANPPCDAKLTKDRAAFFNHVTWADGSHVRMWVNGLAPPCGTCPFKATSLTILDGPTPPLGAQLENVLNTGTSLPSTGVPETLNVYARVFAHDLHSKIMMSNESTAGERSATQLQQRLIDYATYMLAFVPIRSYLHAYYHIVGGRPVKSDIQAYPEEQIYPASAIRTMTDMTKAGYNGTGCTAADAIDGAMVGGAHDLIVACGNTASSHSGVYVREFQRCYSWKTLIGVCAAVVNSTNAAVTVSSAWTYPDTKSALTQTYHHYLKLAGASVSTDNCSNTTGCPTGPGTDLDFTTNVFTIDVTQIPTQSGMILLP